MESLAAELTVNLVRSSAAGKWNDLVSLALAARVVGFAARSFAARHGAKPAIHESDASVTFFLGSGDYITVHGADAELLRSAWRVQHTS